ncbi:unnamed protein product [Rotaria sordida]|uniref:N-acetyltransferase domain-containing protein n=1 Tax=Rotaria sordida TaxID=392033 RepID=A0A815NBM8_9BILA|nr:unnamed protein product [Rotaria sordida]CAF1413980.1 unnamed protein product [Rotaria sordida]CAF1435107.1 unnamed protein product [Rotaria sordida]CAF3907266.1 unnamed protein product [Rotaria sordida]CAF3929036.1 unnamed protein product [Rotaria sordida]
MINDFIDHAEIRNVKYEELEEFWKIQQEYLDNWTFTYLQNQFNKYSSLFIAAFINNIMCGIAYGCDYDEITITLQGICVLFKYWRHGIGSKLLKFFETKVNKIKITVGVASDDTVEKFYLKNNYKPKQFLIRIKYNQLPNDYEQKKLNFHVINEKYDQINEAIILYIETLQYNNELKDNIKKIFHSYETIYIMEKIISSNI